MLGCPDVEETMKWNARTSCYHGILCSMAAFKEHCTFGFRKGSLMKTLKGQRNLEQAMGQYGRITSLADLPGDQIILEQIKEAAKLNADGRKAAESQIELEKTTEGPFVFGPGVEEERQGPSHL